MKPNFADKDLYGHPGLSRPGKPNQRTGPKRKVHEFRPFLSILVFFSLGKQARFTLNFCSGTPLRKVHELTFLWFGLPGPLLNPDLKEQVTLLK